MSRILQHRKGSRIVRAEEAICENSQRMNSNVLRLNYWYMQGMWLNHISKEFFVPLHFYSSLFCSYFIHPNTRCPSWSQSRCQLPRLHASQVTSKEERKPASETIQQESWALWWPTHTRTNLYGYRRTWANWLRSGTSQPVTVIAGMRSSFWLRLIRATFETGQPVFVNHVAATLRGRNGMDVEMSTTWSIPEHS